MIPVNELSRGYRLFQDEYETKALEVLRSGWYVLGKEVEQFEIEFAHKMKEDCYVAGVDNGLNAIHLGLLAAGISAGDEVIVQANGYIATMLAVIQCGAVPVFVEPDEYYQMDAGRIESAISEKTKAILVTHLYGLATRMDEIVEICHKHNLLLFEDCAQSHFATYRGKYTGLFGKAGFFSFYPTKNMGAFGDGGAVLSHDKEYIDKIKTLRNYGSDYRYHNIYIGYNSRLDELQAGLLRVKLSHMEELMRNRNKIAQMYLEKITNANIQLPKIPEEEQHTWYQFVIRTGQRDKFRKFLKENGVMTDVAWAIPPYLQPALSFLNYKRGDFPITERICDTIVSLPMMDDMSEEEVMTVIDIVNKYKSDD